MLSKDDPVYYKVQLKKLLEEANNNGVQIVLDTINNQETRVYFKKYHDCTSVLIKGK